MLLIQNAYVMPMDGSDLPGADILVEDGKIKAVGHSLSAPGAKTLNATGLYALPGLIDAHCHVGIAEEGMRDEGEDSNECSDPLTPGMRALDGINPFDIGLSEAAQNGVTCAMTGPGSGNVLGGSFVLMKTHGRDLDDMVLNPCAAMKAAFGENPKRVYGSQKKTPMTRMAIAALLRQALTDAGLYQEKDGKRNLGMETLQRVVRREIPLKIHAHRADDILTALRIVKEFNLLCSLDHCTEGHLVLPQIQAAGVPVILGPWISCRSKIELAKQSMRAPALFAKAGIPFAFMTDHPVFPLMYLSVEAAIAVREGLPERAALEALTIHPARIVGMADRLGSLTPGKDADLALYDGHPLDMRSKVRFVLINGQTVVE